MKKKILFMSACALLLFTGCFGSKTTTKNETKEVKVKINETEGLNADYSITSNNEIVLSIKNNGSELIDYINVDIAMYDEKGNLMKTEKQYARNVMSGASNVVKSSLINASEEANDVKVPSKVEVVLNKTIYSTKFETVYSDKITGAVEKTETDGQLNLTITNNSGVTIDDLSAAVVFYKDGKMIDIYNISLQSVAESKTETVYVPTAKSEGSISYISYDKAEVVINNASSYNTGA